MTWTGFTSSTALGLIATALLYEAARLPIETPRAERLALRDLPSAHYEEYTTLVIPALGELRDDPDCAREAASPGKA